MGFLFLPPFDYILLSLTGLEMIIPLEGLRVAEFFSEGKQSFIIQSTKGGFIKIMWCRYSWISTERSGASIVSIYCVNIDFDGDEFRTRKWQVINPHLSLMSTSWLSWPSAAPWELWGAPGQTEKTIMNCCTRNWQKYLMKIKFLRSS